MTRVCRSSSSAYIEAFQGRRASCEGRHRAAPSPARPPTAAAVTATACPPAESPDPLPGSEGRRGALSRSKKNRKARQAEGHGGLPLRAAASDDRHPRESPRGIGGGTGPRKPPRHRAAPVAPGVTGPETAGGSWKVSARPNARIDTQLDGSAGGKGQNNNKNRLV